MKRFFTLAAAALLTTTFATSTFAAWGTGGWGVPQGPVVGQSSTPSNHPASAPINTPFNPNANQGPVPGSFQDKVAKGQIGNGPSSKMGYNPNKPIYTKPTNSGVFLPPSQRPSRERTSGQMNYPQYPQQYPTNNGGFFGNDGPVRQRPTNNYPQYPNQYPTNMGNNYPTGNNYPQYPQHTTNYPPMQPQYPQMPKPSKPTNYPPMQPQYPTGGYGGQASGSSWGGYGGVSSTSGYGGQSQYGMFAR